MVAGREAFERDGYLIFDPGIPEATLDAAVATTAGEYRRESRLERIARQAKRAVLGRHTAVSGRAYSRVQDAWTTSPAVTEVATAPGVLTALRELYGREPRPFQTINFRTGSQQAPHSDAMHFNSEPPGLMCGVWLALEDIDEEIGPLIYYPRSHKREELTIDDVGRVTGKGRDAGYGDYEDLVRAAMKAEGFEERHATLSKGEALIWSSNLIHGGAPQRDASRTRWSQVTHYFFDGCTAYWQPIHSADGKRRRFKPVWVR